MRGANITNRGLFLNLLQEQFVQLFRTLQYNMYNYYLAPCITTNIFDTKDYHVVQIIRRNGI